MEFTISKLRAIAPALRRPDRLRPRLRWSAAAL